MGSIFWDLDLDDANAKFGVRGGRVSYCYLEMHCSVATDGSSAAGTVGDILSTRRRACRALSSPPRLPPLTSNCPAAAPWFCFACVRFALQMIFESLFFLAMTGMAQVS